MKAIILRQAGGVANLINADIPKPQVAADQVLVNVKAIGINPVDTSVRSNERWLKYILGLRGTEEYSIIGWDISGVVTETGSAVSKFKIGDEVFGMVNFRGQGKAYAEFVAAPESHLALKPVNITHQEAAGASLAALTAWQGLVTHGKLQAGEKVLIEAAAGGVGHYAIQIAKHFGAYVIGTGSPANKDFILGLGADSFIDYRSQRVEDVVTDVDLAINALRDPQYLSQSIKTVKPGGRLIALVNRFDNDEINREAASKNLHTHALWVTSNGADMERLANLLQRHIIKTHIAHNFSFDQMDKAHLQIETGRTRGKVIVSL